MLILMRPIHFLQTLFLPCFFAAVFTSCSGSGDFPRSRSEKTAQLSAAQAALDLSPTVENQISMGLAHASFGRHEIAIEHYTQALAMNPGSLSAHSHLCMEYNILGKSTEALSHCEQVLSVQPDHAVARNGQRFARKAKVIEGISTAPALINSGLEFYQKGDWAQAIRIWSQVSKKSPHYATARTNLAAAYIKMKDFVSAKEMLDEALSLNPGNELLMNNVRWYEQETGKAL